VLVVAGDLAAGPLDGHYARWLPRLGEVRGPRLAVPGNHDLWQATGATWERHRSWSAHLRDHGWHVLDEEPFRWRGVTFAGNVGWYDYSYFPPATPERDELARAASARLRQVVAGWDDLRRWLPAKRLPRFCRWNDGRFIDWGRADAEVARRFDERLGADLHAALRRGDPTVAVVHHAPFEALVPERFDVRWSFCRAFAGSRATGELLAAAKGLRAVLSGHVHRPLRLAAGTADVRNVAFLPARPEWTVLEV
jgi:3',5'-cyclic AMP phosphodiesterase CpdA